MGRTKAASLTVAACLLASCTFEQILAGQIYRISTPASGGCPSLQWRFLVDPRRAIVGSLASDRQQQIATLSGRLNADDSFLMTATAAPGVRPSRVIGRFTSQVSTISIQGDAAGRACDGQTFELRLGGYFARQGGGGGGSGR